MRIFLACVGAVALVATAAVAADDIMASRYGNTTVIKDASGVTNKVHYKADGTLDGTQGGAAFTGTWKLDGKGKICVTAVPAGTLCTPVYPHKVGDTWTAGGYAISLVAGIQ
jgi:hypothetical protein